MDQDDVQKLFSNLSEADPRQLRQVIDILIQKSRLLIQNLQQTWKKLEQTDEEKCFWKQSYCNLRQACLKYVDSNGLTPFSYIVELENELQREKITKSCLDEKFKIMQNHTFGFKQREKSHDQRFEQVRLIKSNDTGLQISKSSFGGRNNIADSKLQSKHKIGLKRIEFLSKNESKIQS